MRRLTTAANKAGLKTDFFELYWAHLMPDTQVRHVALWLWSLLRRPYGQLPLALRGAYLLLWTLVLAGLGLSLAAAGAKAAGHDVSAWWLTWGLTLLVLPLLSALFTGVVGDAARYLHVAPANIQRRHEIRAAGVQVLQSLHARGFERIVIVGHSLGSVIGYDILTHGWAEMTATEPAATADAALALSTLEEMAASGEQDVGVLHAAQRRLFEQAAAGGARWRVSDFITLGSPLAHAEVLLADNAADLALKMQQREMPACPPVLETTQVDKQPSQGFSYPAGAAARHLHHAAVFAPTRWTNLYFPARGVLHGDLLGGPLKPVFGTAVRDVAVRTRRWFGLLAHTAYWQSDGADEHIAALRAALDLLDAGRAQHQ